MATATQNGAAAAPAFDAEKQIRGMAQFIELEAQEKAAEIRAKASGAPGVGLEAAEGVGPVGALMGVWAKADADAEKQITVANAKSKLSTEYDQKEKALAVEQRISASMAEAHQRSRLLAAREAFVQKLAGEARARLGTVASSNAAAYAVLLKGLIKQAISRLEGERSVEVHARPQDLAVATKAAAAAAAEFAAEAKAAGSAAPAPTVTTVGDAALSGSAGGVTVWALGGRIKCNNTLEARLSTVLYDLTPVVRDVLFPSAAAAVKTKPPVHFAHMPHAAAPPPPVHVTSAVPHHAGTGATSPHVVHVPVHSSAPVATAAVPAPPMADAADPFSFA